MTCKAKAKNTNQQELARMLGQLSLTAAAGQISRLLADAAKQECSYSSFLKQVLKIEINGRFQRKLTRSIKRAKLGSTMSLDEFDFSVRHKLSPAAVKELLDCQWIREGRNIICVGRPGTGKTHVAKALGHAACMKGLVVYYLTAAEILEQMHAALADNTYQKVFRRYTRRTCSLPRSLAICHWTSRRRIICSAW